MRESPHPSNVELLQAADGELGTRRCEAVRSHLSACWFCRTRMADLEAAIAGFTRGCRVDDEPVPPIEGPRALLLARMDEAERTSYRRFGPASRQALQTGVAVFAILALVFGLLIGSGRITRRRSTYNYKVSTTPRFVLTPGAIRIATREELCSAPAAPLTSVVPVSLRRKVLEEYGMPPASADSFELDYLVTPELGGAQDIRNLWPQPYRASMWNAHVKDALEMRLFHMVCSGEIELSTAQHDLAVDWISAYKKYFHTDTPF